MSIIVDISVVRPKPGGTSTGIASKIAALQAQLQKVLQAMKDVASAPGNAKQKAAMNEAYLNQINTIRLQIQMLQNQEAAKARTAQATKALRQQSQELTSLQTEAKAPKKSPAGSSGEAVDTYG